MLSGRLFIIFEEIKKISPVLAEQLWQPVELARDLPGTSQGPIRDLSGGPPNVRASQVAQMPCMFNAKV